LSLISRHPQLAANNVGTVEKGNDAVPAVSPQDKWLQMTSTVLEAEALVVANQARDTASPCNPKPWPGMTIAAPLPS
jgi:hypothetical protein